MPYYQPPNSYETPASSLHTNPALPTTSKKVFYNLKYLPFKWATVALQYDRLALLDLLDR